MARSGFRGFITQFTSFYTFLLLTLLLVTPLFSHAADDSFLIQSRRDVETFVTEADSTSSKGEQFILDLIAWAANHSIDTEPFGLITFHTEPQAATHLTFRNHEIKGFLVNTPYCTIEYLVGGASFDLTATTPGGEVNLYGICGVLSALHSLKKLGVIPTLDGNQDGFIDQDLIYEGKRATGNPGHYGTTADQQEAIYQYFTNNGVKCSDHKYLNGTGGKDACDELLDALERGEDCTLIYRSTELFGDGHAMHIRSAASGETPGACSVETVNTGKQGNGHGYEVPNNYNSHTQNWELGWEEPGQKRRWILDPQPNEYTRGDNPAFWTYQAQTSQFRFRCCKMKKKEDS